MPSVHPLPVAVNVSAVVPSVGSTSTEGSVAWPDDAVAPIPVNRSAADETAITTANVPARWLFATPAPVVVVGQVAPYQHLAILPAAGRWQQRGIGAVYGQCNRARMGQGKHARRDPVPP